VLGGGLYKLQKKCQPKDGLDELLKGFVLTAGGAYLVHLAMDATTPKSLPLI